MEPDRAVTHGGAIPLVIEDWTSKKVTGVSRASLRSRGARIRICETVLRRNLFLPSVSLQKTVFGVRLAQAWLGPMPKRCFDASRNMSVSQRLIATNKRTAGH